MNQLTQITNSASQNIGFSYDAVNRVTSRSFPNSVNTTYSYDGMDRLTKIRDAKGLTKLSERKYEYNTASQISLLEDTIEHAYEYDALDRLKTLTEEESAAESYNYDEVGNRTDSGEVSYSYNTFNRMTSDGTNSYTINANGNTTAGGGKSYTYDYENRLTSAIVAGVTVTYKYDALGRLIQRSPSNGSAVNYVYDGHDVIEDRSTGGTSLMRYLNGPGIDNNLYQKNQSTDATHYFHGDQIGSTTLLTDASGNIAEENTYSAFGVTAGSILTRFLYTGREYDDVTGLMHYRAQWYDPAIGRFMSEDPIGLDGGINLYDYVGSSPLSQVDPFGLRKKRGPYHPPSGIGTKCTWGDTRESLPGKMWLLMRMIDSHTGWDRHMPRHAVGIVTLTRSPTCGVHMQTANTSMSVCTKQDPKPCAEPLPAPLPQHHPTPARKDTAGVPTSAKVAVGAAAAVGTGYIIYRTVRFVPSLAPPRWWTIPANLAIP